MLAALVTSAATSKTRTQGGSRTRKPLRAPWFEHGASASFRHFRLGCQSRSRTCEAVVQSHGGNADVPPGIAGAVAESRTRFVCLESRRLTTKASTARSSRGFPRNRTPPSRISPERAPVNAWNPWTRSQRDSNPQRPHRQCVALPPHPGSSGRDGRIRTCVLRLPEPVGNLAAPHPASAGDMLRHLHRSSHPLCSSQVSIVRPGGASRTRRSRFWRPGRHH